MSEQIQIESELFLVQGAGWIGGDCEAQLCLTWTNGHRLFFDIWWYQQ